MQGGCGQTFDDLTDLPLYLGFFEFVHNVRARGKPLCRVP